MDKRAFEEACRRAAEKTPEWRDREFVDSFDESAYDRVPTFMDLPVAVAADDLEGVDVAFLGMAYEGIKLASPREFLPDEHPHARSDSVYFRTGADEAPAAVRRYSLHHSIHHSYGLFVEYDPDFFIFKHLKAADAGDVDIVPADPDTSFERCEERVGEVVGSGTVPLVCGGDHSITLPVMRAVARAAEARAKSGSVAASGPETHGAKSGSAGAGAPDGSSGGSGRLGLIQFDSHYDLCMEPPHYAGSQFLQILDLPNVDPANFVQIGMRGIRQAPFEVEVAKDLGHAVFTMGDIDRDGIEAVIGAAIERVTDGTDGVYITFDIDVVDPVFCPAQKYPEPAGLDSKQSIAALRRIGAAANIVGFDLCCLGPQYDDRVGTGSHLAARLFVEVLAAMAWRRRGR